MAFEVFTPSHSSAIRRIESGECSIRRNGTAVFLPDDLALVGIESEVVLMLDAGSLRLGLRPRDGDEPTVRVAAVGNAGGRRAVQVGGAIKSLGLEVGAVAGRHSLSTKGSTLIICLAGETLSGGGE